MFNWKCVFLLILAFLFKNNLLAVQDTFSIYLVGQKKIDFQKLKKNLRRVKLENRPLISIDDIISYSKNIHEIELTFTSYDRIMHLDIGTPFVVCIGKKPIYAGIIWSPIYSTASDGVVILKSIRAEKHTIHLQLGYPSPEFYKGKDPRSDPRILSVLEQAGKLKEK